MARSQAQGQTRNTWRFTDKFLPDLAEEGTYMQTARQMEVWIRSDLEGLFRQFRTTELSGDRYLKLGRILTNDESQWLARFEPFVNRAMNLPNDLGKLVEDKDESTALDASLAQLMRQICDSNGMPIKVLMRGKSRQREDPDRMKLRYRVASGLILTVISDLQHGSTFFLRQGLPADRLVPWADDPEADENEPDENGNDSDEDESESESDQPRRRPAVKNKRKARSDSPRKGKERKKPRRGRSRRSSDNHDGGQDAQENREQDAGGEQGDVPDPTEQPNNTTANNGGAAAEDPTQRLHGDLAALQREVGDQQADNELANAQRRVVQLEAALKKAQETLEEVIKVLKKATNSEN